MPRSRLDGLAVARALVLMARRGGVERAEVLNARRIAAFAAAVQPAGGRA